MSEKSDRYRDKAKERELIATRALDPTVRSAYQEMARAWRELADNTEWLLTERVQPRYKSTPE